MQKKTISSSFAVTTVYDGQNGKDGGDGQNAVSYKISCVDTIKPGDDYFNVNIIRSDGASVSRKDLFHAKNDWGVTLSCTGLAGAVVEDNKDSQVNVSNCTITGSTTLILRLMLSGVIVDEKYVRGVIDGADGNPGHVGRWYYYAEEWASGNTYTMQETQAPFVKRHTTINGVEADYFFMLDFGTRGISTGSTRGEDPASHYNPVSGRGTEPWTLMQSTMQYYIAKAYFGEYAHLGSFIINKDWMISQYGTLVDSSGKETKVDGGGANPIVLYGNNVHSGTIIVRVQFTSSGTASITATASSEGGYDKGYVKNSGGSTLIEVSGTQSETVNQSVSSGGYIDLSYTKDVSVSSNDDKITFNISGVGYTLSLVSATSGMTYTGSSSSGGVIPSDPYIYFDPTDPMASTPPSSGYKFRPNVAIDGLTGKTYQNDAYIKGKVYATDGEFTGIIHADSGEFKGDIIVTSGSNTVKINSSGFEGRWGSDGIKLGTSGLQRWHPDTQSWVNMYGNRYVKIVSASSYQISVHDDFIVSTSTNTKLILPAGTDGKVISIKTIGHTVGLYPGKTSSGGNQYIVTDHDITNDHQDINNYDRVELVYYGVRWYWNFMSI